MKREADEYWWNLKDQAKTRAKQKSYGKCEYCWLRPHSDLHHRHYQTEGRERLVMLVCRLCHNVIHAFRGGEIYVHEDSLASKGDRGTDLWYYPDLKTQQWRDYLGASSTERVQP